MDLDIHTIREIISNRALQHVRDCHIEDINEYLIFQSFPGSGKTTSIMKTIDEHNYNWIYLAPFHSVIKENIKYSNVRDYNFVHLKGKKQDGVCQIQEYRKLAKRGFNITPFCETTCPFKNSSCPYYKTLEEIETIPQSWAGVHSHIPSYLQTYLFGKEYEGDPMYTWFDVLIIDEFPIQTLLSQGDRITRHNINHLRDILSYYDGDNEAKDIIMNLLNEMTLATNTIDMNYVKVHDIINSNRGLDFNKFQEEFDSLLLRLVSDKIIKEPPRNLIYLFSRIYEQNPDIDTLRYNIYKKKDSNWGKGGFYINVSNLDYFQSLPLPIIALDATADILAWNTLLGKECESERIDIEYKHIYQLKSYGKYYTSSWITYKNGKEVLSSTGKRLAQIIQKICNRKDHSVLICSSKRIRSHINKYLSKHYNRKNYKFAIFYNLRSRNSFYEECDTCIIAHQPGIPPEQVEIRKAVLGWTPDLIKNLLTTCEIKQAIGRIRQNIKITPSGRVRDKVEVYIFPGALREKNKLVKEAKLINKKDMEIGHLVGIRDSVINIIYNHKTITFKTLKYITELSRSMLKRILKSLYTAGYISNYKGKIEWIYDVEKANKPKYKRY